MYTWKKWSGHVTVGEVYVKQGRWVDVGTQHKQFKIFAHGAMPLNSAKFIASQNA